MKIFKIRIAGLLAAVMAAACLMTTAQAQTAKPLFQSDEVIKIRIEAPLTTLARSAKRSIEPYDAVLTHEGAGALPITLAARGRSRRSTCRFPPLRVRFKDKPKSPSLFSGQKGLKLVTHCQGSTTYQQYTLLEYTAYKMLNVLTDESLKVRMAQIEYFDTRKNKVIATKQGFFIEDTDDAAKRTGYKELDLPKITPGQLDPVASARTELFQYMIGNLDWSIRAGAANSDCCHNAKLMGRSKAASQNFIPVPYDFDSAGIVDATHAVPAPGLKVNTVRDRLYRGFCVRNDLVRAQAGQFLQKREALMAVINDTPGLDKKRSRKARSYMEEFFGTLSNPKSFENRVMKKCRK